MLELGLLGDFGHLFLNIYLSILDSIFDRFLF